MDSLTKEQLNDALIRLNILRSGASRDPIAGDLLEGALEALFSMSQHLIVYGSLTPGGPNHGLISGLEGEWVDGWLTGELLERGWSAAMSYPSLRWCPEGSDIPARLFISWLLSGREGDKCGSGTCTRWSVISHLETLTRQADVCPPATLYFLPERRGALAGLSRPPRF
jgi:hypothetical protein